MSSHREAPLVQFEHDLIHKAIDDEAFWDQLFADPNATVAKELAAQGGKLADGVKVHVLEESDDTVYIVFPRKPSKRMKHDKKFDPYGLLDKEQ